MSKHVGEHHPRLLPRRGVGENRDVREVFRTYGRNAPRRAYFEATGDTRLYEYVELVPALAGAIAPSTVLLAGIYQLTPMKHSCLAHCHQEGTAFAHLTTPENHNLWIMGLQHGMFCLGSCWALMLLMFAIGGVKLAWMLILSAI